VAVETSLEKERIAKFLARSGVASRRDAERLIAAGQIAVNGQVVTNPGTRVGDNDVLTVDGRPIAQRERARLWRYHKPPGLVTTARDPQGRPTVFAALPKSLPRVISVGRLDINTEGLLLLTNDGGLARYLEHPAQSMARRYRVRVHGEPARSKMTELERGATVDGVRYRPVRVSIDNRKGSNCWISVTVSEGKNREIRKLMRYAGLQVTRLIRTGYGPFELGELASGAVEEVPPQFLRRVLSGYFDRRNAHGDKGS
jgi:23S rRNA pseudouridine2605 synthase